MNLLAEDAVTSEPVSAPQFPATGKNTGKFEEFRLFSRQHDEPKPLIHGSLQGCGRTRSLNTTGNFHDRIREIRFSKQGKISRSMFGVKCMRQLDTV
jgi:hypothetical protein